MRRNDYPYVSTKCAHTLMYCRGLSGGVRFLMLLTLVFIIIHQFCHLYDAQMLQVRKSPESITFTFLSVIAALIYLSLHHNQQVF